MAHNILGNRFYNRSNKPAWHHLGINDPSDHTAEEALRRIGHYDVRKVPLYAELPDGTMMETENFAIIREPMAEDNRWRVFGQPVSADYELIAPLHAAQLFDQNVTDLQGNPVKVETVGILGKGERLFITTELPRFSIKGDEMANYLLFDNPMQFGYSAGGYTTPVRVVCQNTLSLGLRAARQSFAVTHSAGSAELLANWLKEMYGHALEAAMLAEEAFNAMSNMQVRTPQIKWITENLYPMPKKPEAEAANARRPYADRLDAWRYNCELTQRYRSEVEQIFEGKGVGMNHISVNGTAFGAYNAVAEFETYRRGSATKTAEQLIAGSRGARIRNAFKLAVAVDRYETVSVDTLELEYA